VLRENVERAALLILLALIPLRAVIAETHVFEVPRWFRDLPAPPGAQPATTLLIVAVILCTAVAVCAPRLWSGGRRNRRTGAELGAALLLAAAVIATWRAGQKHLAVIGVLDFLGMVLYLLTLRQVLTRPWHIRLAMAVVLGTGAMVVSKCAYQRWVEWPETVKYYEEHKTELIGTTPGEGGDTHASGFLHDYERRLASGLVTGYYAHSNVLGSHLILIVMAGLAVAVSRFRRRPAWTLIVPLLIAAGGVSAMFYAQSKGAIAACGAALLAWVIGRWIISRNAQSAIRNRLWVVLWLAVLLGACATVGVLKSNPEALGRSMLFRSMYWQGAWDMLCDQGPWGVGPNNFGRFFTRYKSVKCPEEVESPHSWVAQAAAEWGVLGLVGLLLLFIGVSRQLARGEKGDISGDGGRGGSAILWMAGIGVIVLGWWAGLLSEADAGFVALVMILAALPWLVGFIFAAIEDAQSTTFLDDDVGPLLAGLCAGLIGFVLHTGIDLAMFHSGAATTFFAMMAIALAVYEFNACTNGLCPKSPRPWPGGAANPDSTSNTGNAPQPRLEALGGSSHFITALLVGAAGLTGVLLLVVLLVLPAAGLGRNLREARLNTQPSSWEHYTSSHNYQAYMDGMDCYRLDGTAIEELVDELIPRVATVGQADKAITLVEAFHRRDPASSIAWHQLATLYAQRFELGRDVADLQRAIDNMRKAVAAYPTSPTKRLMLAGLLEKLAEVTGLLDDRHSAAEALQAALDLDAQRVYVSKPHRFTEQMRAELEGRIARLRHHPPALTPDP